MIIKIPLKRNKMYIEVEIILENIVLKDVGITDEIISKMILNTDGIDAVRQDVDDEGELITDECVVYMRGGAAYTIKYPYAKLKYILDVNQTI